MICFIYPFRNRELQRVKRSLDSLRQQTDTDFRVEFVDYGSHPNKASAIKDLLGQYAFANYRYHAVTHQPWNKCRALNSVIRDLEDPYCFVADVDMIFHPELVSVMKQLQHPQKAHYFQVGFLDAVESGRDLAFSDYKTKFLSDEGATGLTLFPTSQLQKLRGFDEFYHFWGSEDTDVHVRLRQAGVPVNYYDQRLLMLHQWHKIYRAGPRTELTQALRVGGIERINYHYLQMVKAGHGPEVNPHGWGLIPGEDQLKCLDEVEPIPVGNERSEVDAFINGVLPGLKKGVHAFKFTEGPNKGVKDGLKGIFGKNKRSYLNIKQLNDSLLMAIVSRHRHRPYSFEVDMAEPALYFRVLVA